MSGLKELFSTQDPGEAALVQSLLESAGIKFFLFDEGGGGYGTAFVPQRIMVAEGDLKDAEKLLAEMLS